MPVEFEFEMYGRGRGGCHVYGARGVWVLLNAVCHVDPATSQRLNKPNLRGRWSPRGLRSGRDLGRHLSRNLEVVKMLIKGHNCGNANRDRRHVLDRIIHVKPLLKRYIRGADVVG